MNNENMPELRAKFEAWATEDGTYDLRGPKWIPISHGGVPHEGYIRPYQNDRTLRTFEGFCAAYGQAGRAAAIPAGMMLVPVEAKERAAEIIKQLDALYNAKRPGGGVHGQVVGMEPWTIRTTGDGLQCIYEAQALLNELLDPFDRIAAAPSQPAVKPVPHTFTCICDACCQPVPSSIGDDAKYRRLLHELVVVVANPHVTAQFVSARDALTAYIDSRQPVAASAKDAEDAARLNWLELAMRQGHESLPSYQPEGEETGRPYLVDGLPGYAGFKDGVHYEAFATLREAIDAAIKATK